MFRLSSIWRRRPRPVRAARRTGSAEERAPGCGWFDSSHELNHGLRVTEHASPDPVAADLPLSDWLGLQLAACSADGRVAA